jgi:carbohydrate esterase-like sialic acid-specific acetylesterase
MSLILSTLLLCCPVAAQVAPTPQVHFSAFPQDLQIVPRDADGYGQVQIAGQILTAEAGHLQLQVWRNHELWLDKELPPVFSTSIAIPAELANYTFTASWIAGGQTRLLDQAQNVAAGDVYLISGQSNANAIDYQNEQLGNQHQRHWIRSFGSASTNPNEVAADLDWHLAEAETGLTSGSVGTWGLRMAQLLLDEYQIPIALLNGAVGGTQISYHLRNDLQHADMNTAYGRLLWRAQAAGVADKAKAFFWYQGESDGMTSVPVYSDRFYDLYLDWQEDCIGLREIYLMPVMKGCGNPTLLLRDQQRRAADELPNITVMSVTATGAHDGCHFFYAGYREIGNRLARILARDFYGSLDIANITPPNPLEAQFANAAHDQILVTYRVPTDQLIVGPEVYLDFHLGDGPEVVTSATLAGPGQILLTLDQPTQATNLAYRGHAGNGGDWLMNSRGVGALVFKGLPILP